MNQLFPITSSVSKIYIEYAQVDYLHIDKPTPAAAECCNNS